MATQLSHFGHATGVGDNTHFLFHALLIAHDAGRLGVIVLKQIFNYLKKLQHFLA
jgi:hypothetical protein